MAVGRDRCACVGGMNMHVCLCVCVSLLRSDMVLASSFQKQAFAEYPCQSFSSRRLSKCLRNEVDVPGTMRRIHEAVG